MTAPAVLFLGADRAAYMTIYKRRSGPVTAPSLCCLLLQFWALVGRILLRRVGWR